LPVSRCLHLGVLCGFAADRAIFSLDGLGRLGFESVIKRDYPVVFATLFIFSLLGLVVN
jgi:ABC-type microcin C transport system permease subunit YejB